MNIEQIERCIAAVGGALLPHQRRAVTSDAEIVVLSGDSATGKTFTLVPWLLSLDAASTGNFVVTPTMRVAEYAMHDVMRWLQRTGHEWTCNRKPPSQWNSPKRTHYRNVLTVRGGAQVALASASMRQLRGVRVSSLFVDDALIANSIEADSLSDLVRHADRAIITSYNGGGTAAALRLGGVTKSIEVVRVEPFSNAHNLSTAYVAAMGAPEGAA